MKNKNAGYNKFINYTIIWENQMAVNYDKLWKLLIDKKINRSELKKISGISFNVLARMEKEEPVSMESMDKICTVLECAIGDVMEFKH